MLVPEVTRHKVGVQTLYIRDGAEQAELYKRAGTAETLSELADHDGPALINGRFRTVKERPARFTLHHPYGGRVKSLSEDELDKTAVKLREVKGDYVEPDN